MYTDMKDQYCLNVGRVFQVRGKSMEVVVFL